MSNYYYTCYDKEHEERMIQKKAEGELIKLIQRPIKWNVFPEVVTSNTDKRIENRLYQMRQMYSYRTSPLHKGEYVYTGHDKVSVYSSLYNEIFYLNRQVWEVPPLELATAYLELWEEYETFEKWKPYTDHYDTGLTPDCKTMRLAARKCGLSFCGKLDIANNHGLADAIMKRTTGYWTIHSKDELKKFTDIVREEIKRGDKCFEGELYGMKEKRSTLPCAYTILNLFVGMYREIYRRHFPNEKILPPTYLENVKGFEEYTYQQKGGQGYDISKAILITTGIVFLLMLITSVVTGGFEGFGIITLIFFLPCTIVGVAGMIEGADSQ